MSYLDRFVWNVRYVGRTLRRDLRFTALSVLTLSVGVISITAVFVVAHPLLIRKLPVHEPDQLVQFRRQFQGPGTTDAIPFEFFQQLRGHQESALGSVFAHLSPPNEIGVSDNGVDVSAAFRLGWVSGEYFQTLGVRPIIGRPITEDDEPPGALPVAVIGYRVWESHFEGHPEILGMPVRLLLPIQGLTQFTIVGVAPREFRGVTADFSQDIWLPLSKAPSAAIEGVEPPPVVQVMGRLRSGQSVDQAAAQARLIYGRVFPDENPRLLTVERAARGVSRMRFEYGEALAVLGVITVMALLMSWTNVSALQAVRENVRNRDIAIQMAIGAGRRSIVSQILLECVIVAACAASLALISSQWVAYLALRFLPVEPGFISSIELGGHATGFVIAVSAVSALLLCGISVSRLQRSELNTLQRVAASAYGHDGSGLTHRWIISGQIAFSLVLLIAGGLFVRTFLNSHDQDAVLARSEVLQFVLRPSDDLRARLEMSVYGEGFGEEFYNELLSHPDIESATHYEMDGILGRPHETTPLRIPGYTVEPLEELTASVFYVGPRFFETFSIPLILGRDFRDADVSRETSPLARFQLNPTSPTSESVAGVINERMARHFFGLHNPIGRTIYNGDKNVEIVGVVGDLGHGNLTDRPDWLVYRVNYTQRWSSNRYAVPVSTDVSAEIYRIRNLVSTTDSNWRAIDFETIGDVVDRTYVRERFMAFLGGSFGVVALILLSIGTYGLVASDVARRRAELGLRVALGATRTKVIGTIARPLCTALVVGVVGGLLITMASTAILTSVLFGVAPMDSPTVLLAMVMLSISFLSAACFPIWRIVNAEPIEMLRRSLE